MLNLVPRLHELLQIYLIVFVIVLIGGVHPRMVRGVVMVMVVDPIIVITQSALMVHFIYWTVVVVNHVMVVELDMIIVGMSINTCRMRLVKMVRIPMQLIITRVVSRVTFMIQ